MPVVNRLKLRLCEADLVKKCKSRIRIFAGNFAPAGWMFCEGQLLPISERNAVSVNRHHPPLSPLSLEISVEHFLLAFVDAIGENGNRRQGDAARLQPSSSIINLEPIHLIGTDEFLRSAAHYRTDVAGL